MNSGINSIFQLKLNYDCVVKGMFSAGVGEPRFILLCADAWLVDKMEQPTWDPWSRS